MTYLAGECRNRQSGDDARRPRLRGIFAQKKADSGCRSTTSDKAGCCLDFGVNSWSISHGIFLEYSRIIFEDVTKVGRAFSLPKPPWLRIGYTPLHPPRNSEETLVAPSITSVTSIEQSLRFTSRTTSSQEPDDLCRTSSLSIASSKNHHRKGDLPASDLTRSNEMVLDEIRCTTAKSARILGERMST